MPSAPTGIAVTSKISKISFGMLLFKPTITIDGEAHAVAWSRVEVPCAPGTHTVEMWWRYLGFFNANKAHMTVEVADGAMTEVTYQARWMGYMKGKISAQPVAVAA